MTLAATYPAHLEILQRGYAAALATYGYDALVLCSGSAALRSRFDDRQRSRWWRTITIRVRVTTVGIAAHRHTRCCNRQRGHR